MAYRSLVFGAGTKFSPEENGVWQLVDTNGDGSPDLVYIKTGSTGTGTIEVHISRNESLFQESTQSIGTVFPLSDGPNGQWELRDWTGDGKADLVYIKNRNTGTGKVEIHIADGSSNYSRFVLQTTTAFAVEDNGIWSLSHKGDLVYVKTRATPGDKVEIHIASRASNYQSFTTQTQTAFSIEPHTVYAIAPKGPADSPNLYSIKTGGASSGNVEISALTSASGWKQTYLPPTPSCFGSGDEFGTWTLAHFSHQRDPDLVYIKSRNVASGTVEVFVCQPYYLKPNSFLETSRNIQLVDGHIITGELKRNDGSYRNGQVDLDTIIGNANGSFNWGTKSFSASARNVKLSQTSLTAELRTPSGSWEEDSIDVGDLLFNNDGAFKAVDVPVIVAIPAGQEASFMQSLGDTLKHGDIKLEVGNDEEDGSTLWHYSAGASSSLDRTGWFRTYGAEAKASVFKVATDAEHDILKTEFSFFSVGASAKTERLENFKLQATYVGAEAHYNVVEGKVGALDFNLGVGVDAGIGIKDQSLDLQAGIVGVTIGRKMGLSFMGSSVSVDFGVIGDAIGSIFG